MTCKKREKEINNDPTFLKSMESYVNCPKCGESVRAVLEPMNGAALEFAKDMSRSLGLGIDESTRFVAEGIKCKCGKIITVSMTVTAMESK
jgi:phosphomannomutase